MLHGEQRTLARKLRQQLERSHARWQRERQDLLEGQRHTAAEEIALRDRRQRDLKDSLLTAKAEARDLQARLQQQVETNQKQASQLRVVEMELARVKYVVR